jgi:hypothetical protein
MNDVDLLLRAYWETLYDQLTGKRDKLETNIDLLLRREVEQRGLEGFDDEERYGAYRDACLAFIEERIEQYNPFGAQYTFDSEAKERAGRLQFELDWFGGREEFDELVSAARRLAEPGMSEGKMQEAAKQLIRQRGAYPDRSIISGYEAKPALNRMPDYIVALAIEQIIL